MEVFSVPPATREPLAAPSSPGIDVSGLAEILSARGKPTIQAGDGLKIILRGVPNLTDPDVLDSPFFFQSPPIDNFTWTASHTHDDYDTINAGQFSRPSSRQLKSTSFSTLFIDWDAPWALTAAVLPIKVAHQLVAIQDTGTPFRLIVHQAELWGAHHHELDTLATLRSISVEHRGGEPDTRYVSMDVTEFRDPSARSRGPGNRKPPMHKLPTSARLVPVYQSTAKHAPLIGVRVEIRNGRDMPASKGATFHDLVKEVYGSSSSKTLGKVRQANKFLKDVPGSQKLSKLIKKRNLAVTITLPK